MFTKKHFELIARVMQESAPASGWRPRERAQWEVTCSRLADEFGASCPRFNRARFLAACVPGANVKAR